MSKIGQGVDDTVQRFYERVRARVWDEDMGDDDDAALTSLTPVERAVYITRELEQELADGGWSYVFANADGYLIEEAIEAYELLGCASYVAHLRDIEDAGYTDASPDEMGEALDEMFAGLSGAEEARAALLRQSLEPR